MKKPIAYSYIRFSTANQTDGNSEQRQVELAQNWAKAKGVKLDMGYIDRAMPSFRGKNRKKGALKDFIKAVESGHIKRGSYLVVEDPDRLSREHPYDTIATIRGLLSYGIVLVVARSGDEYTDENIRADTSGMKLVKLTLEFGRASADSARKSDLLTKSWIAKRQRAMDDGGRLTSMAPAWIETIVTGEGRIKDRKFKLHADRAKIVREIYSLHLANNGTRAIAKILNDRKVPNWGRGKRKATHWHSSYVAKILANPAVTGEYRPHEFKIIQDPDDPKERKQIRVPTGEVWEDYYPLVVKKTIFNEVQTRAENRGKRGITGGRITNEISNLFPGLVYGLLPDPLAKLAAPNEPGQAARIHVPCCYKSKGTERNCKYLVAQTDPVNMPRKKKDEVKTERWPYHAVEYAILTTLEEINWRTIAGEGRTPEQTILAEKASKLDAIVKELREDCRNLGIAIAKRPLDTLVEQLSEMETERQAASEEASAARRKLEQLELDRGGLIKPLEIQKAAHDPAQREIRLALRAELAKRIDNIQLTPKRLVPKVDPLRDRTTHIFSFEVTIRFVNGITRVCRVTMNKGKNPILAAVAFQPSKGKPLPVSNLVNDEEPYDPRFE